MNTDIENIQRIMASGSLDPPEVKILLEAMIRQNIDLQQRLLEVSTPRSKMDMKSLLPNKFKGERKADVIDAFETGIRAVIRVMKVTSEEDRNDLLETQLSDRALVWHRNFKASQLAAGRPMVFQDTLSAMVGHFRATLTKEHARMKLLGWTQKKSYAEYLDGFSEI